MNAICSPPREDPSPQVWPAPHHLVMSRGHRMAWREAGASDGDPWLLLHGGPGSGCQPGMLAPLDLRRHRVIAPDQRGSGASRPHGRIRGNQTAALVSDMEALRRHLGVSHWQLLAGSWGAVLALAYAQRHPQRVKALVLRGAFALSRREIGGLLLPTRRAVQALGSEPFWPVRTGMPLPVALRRLTQVLQSGTPRVAGLRVARRWSLLETALAERGMRRSARHAVLEGGVDLVVAIRAQWAALRRHLRQARTTSAHPRISRTDRLAIGKYRVQAHYLRHRGFLRPADLGRAVQQLAKQEIPVQWVHGRFDAVCPPANSRRGSTVWGDLTLTHSGHLGGEPDTLAALRRLVQEASC